MEAKSSSVGKVEEYLSRCPASKPKKNKRVKTTPVNLPAATVKLEEQEWLI